jgi:L-histidine N-alpha-methyltransferase
MGIQRAAAGALVKGPDDGGRWRVVENERPVDMRERLGHDVRVGLTASPPWLPARWFYDEKGGLLFDDITALPEYYPTRRETEILTARSGEIADWSDATTLVELGSGTSTKTRLLLDALIAGNRPLLFVPLDVSAELLAHAARTIAADYPTVTVEAHVADFSEEFGTLPGEPGRRLIAFLGGTIGNFNTADRADFFRRLRAAVAPGDHLLLGADLVKDAQRLVAAYDDSAGVTAAFNRNIIDVVARELHAESLSADDFDHVARWNADKSQIEMWLRAVRDVEAYFPTLDLSWQLPAGGELLTEISVKFTVVDLQAELAAAGLATVQCWTDEAADFSLTLARVGPPFSR